MKLFSLITSEKEESVRYKESVSNSSLTESISKSDIRTIKEENSELEKENIIIDKLKKVKNLSR